MFDDHPSVPLNRRVDMEGNRVRMLDVTDRGRDTAAAAYIECTEIFAREVFLHQDRLILDLRGHPGRRVDLHHPQAAPHAERLDDHGIRQPPVRRLIQKFLIIGKASRFGVRDAQLRAEVSKAPLVVDSVEYRKRGYWIVGYIEVATKSREETRGLGAARQYQIDRQLPAQDVD